MSLEKSAEQDGREVWLAVLDSPQDPAGWGEPASHGFGLLAYLDGWDGRELEAFAAAAAALRPREAAFGGETGQDAREAFAEACQGRTPCSAREDEPLDESLWYMFFASYERDASTLRQPPLIVAFLPGDPLIAEFRGIAARFAAAMNEVLDRE